LLFAVVAEGSTRQLYFITQNVLGYHATGPQLVKKLITRYQSVAVANQKDQQIEDLRLNGDGLAVSRYREVFCIQLHPAEVEDHRT
jgi:hypothetical protein